MIEVKEGVDYITTIGWQTGCLKWWSAAGFFTGPLLPGMRWDKHGRELTDHLPYNTMRISDDIAREYKECEDDDQQEKSETES